MAGPTWTDVRAGLGFTTGSTTLGPAGDHSDIHNLTTVSVQPVNNVAGTLPELGVPSLTPSGDSAIPPPVEGDVGDRGNGVRHWPPIVHADDSGNVDGVRHV